MSYNNNKSLSSKNIIAYMGTEFSATLLYCVLTSFITYYYTDVFGISIGAVAIIMLVVRIVNAATVPMWGIAIDKTKSRYGKSRPWFARLAIPFAAFTTLTLFTPNLSVTAKTIYAAVTYLIANTLHTGISIPITSILPSLSNDSYERTKLNSFRNVGGNIGGAVTSVLMLPLVYVLGAGNEQRGFFFTAMMYSIIAAALFLFAFKNTKEVNAERVKSLPVRDCIKALKGNSPWFILVSGYIFFWFGYSTRISSLVYYSRYYLGNEGYVSVFNLLILCQAIGTIAIPILSKKISKAAIMILGLSISAVSHALVGIAGHNIILIIIMQIPVNIGVGMSSSVPNVMLADTIDYGEYKNGIRAVGFLTALGTAGALQLGTGLGNFIPLKVMELFGYAANQQQTASSLSAIRFVFAYMPAICFIIGVFIILFYTRFEKQENKIKKALYERRGL